MKKSVFAIIFSNDGKQILLVTRRDVPDVWTLPGGGVDPGETPDHAIIRECHEETGCDIALTRQSGEYLPVNHLTTLTYVFCATLHKGTPLPSDETAQVALHPINQLPHSLFPIHKGWIQDALTHTHLVKKNIEGAGYLDVFLYFLRHPQRTLNFLRTRLRTWIQ